MTTPRKMILDCDPGHDDAVAILLAHGNPDVELLAITTVAGNQTIENTTRNALAIATVGGITGVPIARGAAAPLVRPARHAAEIHGESGLDGPVLPEPTVALDERHAADLIIELVMSHEPGEITLVAVGPLTNVAIAAHKEPRIVERLREVVLMGGGMRFGNATAAAEFNIFFDPEAAHVVFSLPWHVTMIGLDVTHEAKATPDVRAAIESIGNPPARFVGELLDFYGSAYESQQGFDAPPVHDPCAVAMVIDPTLFEVMTAPVVIELTGTHTAGMTLVDQRPWAAKDGTTHVATTIDAPRFWALVADALRRL